MMLKSCLIILTLLIFSCQAVEFSTEESHVLEKFFRTMIKDSEAGYVIFNKKPVCIVGFCVKDFFINENERHQESINLREGASLLKKARLKTYCDNIIVHIYDREDSLVKNCIHVLFVNKSLFIETVRSNLSLFQYVLGPKITPENLLDKILDPKESFHNVLKNDKVLIGIVLGFGTQNALYGSRIENIEDALFAAEQVPFKSQLSKIEGIRAEYLKSLLLRNSKPLQDSKAVPSFSFDSLKDEVQYLMAEMDISSLKLAADKPSFMFGRLKHDKDTDIFVHELEKIQSKINLLLDSKNFLEQVLTLVYPKEKIKVNLSGNRGISFEKSVEKKLPFLVAANIWSHLDGEDAIYLEAFISGMQEGEKNSSISEKLDLKEYAEYEKIGAYLKIKENLSKTKKYFDLLRQDSTVHCLIPSQLYYRVKQNGSGLVFNNENLVLLHYLIKTPDNQTLVDTWMRGDPIKLYLSETIPGFAHGLKGMKIGEIREIFIHPSLAYGIYTTLDKGIYLNAYVQLLSFTNDNEADPFPELTSSDLTIEVSPTIESDYLELTKKVAFKRGYHIWKHYKKCRLYSLNQILEEISQFQSGKSADISTEESQKIINRLHWNLYL